MLKNFSQKARREERFQKPNLMMGRKCKNGRWRNGIWGCEQGKI